MRRLSNICAGQRVGGLWDKRRRGPTKPSSELFWQVKIPTTFLFFFRSFAREYAIKQDFGSSEKLKLETTQ